MPPTRFSSAGHFAGPNAPPGGTLHFSARRSLRLGKPTHRDEVESSLPDATMCFSLGSQAYADTHR